MSTTQQAEDKSAAAQAPTLESSKPVVQETTISPTPVPTGPSNSPELSAIRIKELSESARQALTQQDIITARTHFSEALALGPAEPERSTLCRELVKLGDETVFSPRVYEHDPLVGRTVLQTGATLAKVAAEHQITADLLASINYIADKNLIRAGQAIKVLRGPFHAKVEKKSYQLNLFLGDVLVKQFSVGLGADDGTPSGIWRVSSKLANPTYYPPRGGNIIAADDPKNPLGERWIGLTGIEGSAIGQERYGIHGTIEPESIGKSTSMGCIRLRNEDVELLYTCLVDKHSTVTVR